MPLSNLFSLIRGHLYEKAQEVAAPYVDKLLNTLAPKASFADGFTKAVTGNVNKSDNWGTFGTFLGSAIGSVAKAYTEPNSQTNSALPPTTGTITEYAPAVIQAEPPVVEIPEKGYKNVSSAKLVKELKKRKAAQAKKKVAPPKKRGVAKKTKTTGKKKTVNEMTAPKKKKTYSYKVDI